MTSTADVRAARTTGTGTLSVLTGPRMGFEEGRRIEELVERWARTRPDAPAVRWKGHHVGYADLVAQAGRVARALADIGVGASEVVAVRTARSPEMIAALLGVMKLGAVYTAVPAEWPEARLEEVLRRTGARICVTDEGGSPIGGVPTVGLRELCDGTAQVRQALPARGAAVSADACCVFFTSGSTGTPKCVLSPHLGTIRVAREATLGFGEHTVMLQSAPVAWDGFAFEVWCPLINGGTTVLRDSEHFGYDDIRLAVARGVNTVFLTPTLFNATVDDDIEALAGLEAVMLGGEKASAKHISTAIGRFPGLRVHNLYGPVEATMCPTGYLADGTERDEVPIGVPVAATGVYLLDDDGRIVPWGETGEIAVSGAGLALCYLGDPQESARRFPLLPLGDGGEETRVYLTGDLGVIAPDGRLRYRGRKDRQLKVRGVRVEPGEVERAICALPGVGSAAVVPLPLGGVTVEALAAFYTASSAVSSTTSSTASSTAGRPDEAQAQAPTEEAVYDALSERLPAAFVPNVIRRIATLPVTSTGKIDVTVLAEILHDTPRPDVATPGGTLEVVLRHVNDLLGYPVGPQDDIFQRGATSIAAIQLANRIGGERGVELPVSVFLRGRTPAKMAEALDDPLLLGEQD
ncbi:non-ribosomal peptide synthetase [Streptosporangium sp. CA-135522]|uniref:non-ribosomal peptide synthetase n=1 Tax=Streptosporangium sp. CA-135522 TaxID=3240072 RepID=UPI003D8A0510